MTNSDDKGALQAFVEAKRFCWYCGLIDHEHQSCPTKLASQPRTLEGKNAEKRYRKCLENLRIQNGTNRPKRIKHKLHQFIEMKKYFSSAYLDHYNGEPYALIKRDENLNDMMEDKFLMAHRQFFSYIIGNLQKKLIDVFQEKYDDFDYSSSVKRYRSKGKASPWIYSLNHAVKNGTPADFSNHIKNRIYTVEKVTSRTRYLHHLIMDWNPISNSIREILYDKIQRDHVSVMSIGGGPAFDHIAIWIIMLFLRNMNNQNRQNSKQWTIKTQIFDLYLEWTNICNEVELSFTDILNELDENITVDAHPNRDISVHHCDLRLELHDSANTQVQQSLNAADIICVQYVTHENSSFILDDDDKYIRGLFFGILVESEEGTIIVFTDSGNFVWPKLKSTAIAYGWFCFGDDDKRSSGGDVRQGPKSFVMLQRKFMVYDTVKER